ncbi:hypothetical protein, partial [Paraburkholderia sp. RL17-373-BIF-A]|uniref:hypothetical protein n=1 Tax=Paraburkholderia sp. RL17-373-BIF-A TaxID=3031629 RepID=UPI0038BD570B
QSLGLQHNHFKNFAPRLHDSRCDSRLKEALIEYNGVNEDIKSEANARARSALSSSRSRC